MNIKNISRFFLLITTIKNISVEIVANYVFSEKI